MGDIPGNVPFSERSPLVQLFISLLIVLSVGVVLFTLAMVAGLFIFDVKTELLQNPSAATSINDISFLRYMLISQDILIFIIPSVLIMRMLKPPGKSGFIDAGFPGIKDIVLVILLAFCLFPVTGFTGYLNSQLQLPEWLSGVQKWITDKEDSAIGFV